MERIEVLRWERISLVVPEREDAKIWWKWINDIENQTFLGFFGKIFYLEDEYEFYESLRKNKGDRTFSIFLHETSEIIGNVSLFGISEKHRNATFGILIADKKYQNMWLGTEATKLIVKYGFEVFGLNKIKLEVHATNPRAQKVYEKCGFSVSGILKEERFDGEKYFDMVCMEILRKDFFQK